MKTNYSFVTRVENTPFSIIQDFEGKFAITIANNVVSKPQESQEDCMKLIEKRDWELIANSICAITGILKTIDKYEEQEESTNGNS